MSLTTARWFVLGTGALALMSVVIAAVMGARLHQSRTDLVQLQHQPDCPSAKARTP